MPDPVDVWLGRLAARSRPPYRSIFGSFMKWLRVSRDWSGFEENQFVEAIKGHALEPGELLAWQRTHIGSYDLLDVVERFVSEGDYCLRTKKTQYTAIRSFFMHNRCALPDDPSFKVRSDKRSSPSLLCYENVVDIAKAANLRDQSIVLVKWQSMQDNVRTVYIGTECAEQIVTQIRRGIHPVRIDIPDRKQNEQNYFTFIGKDAVDALTEYFEKERGWPKPGEPIWLTNRGEEISTTWFQENWMRLVERAGLLRKKREMARRYGFNPHEMRDVAKSLLHTHALKDGFDLYCSEFWLGHEIDKNRYDKFYNDFEYVRSQYLIAEKYLNIISRPAVSEEQRHQEQETVLKMRRELDAVIQRLDRLIPAKAAP
jgi:site-specific recombinase XerD